MSADPRDKVLAMTEAKADRVVKEEPISDDESTDDGEDFDDVDTDETEEDEDLSDEETDEDVDISGIKVESDEEAKESISVPTSPAGGSCPICLNGLALGQDIGTPDGCEQTHHFCLDCIEEWSKVGTMQAIAAD